MEPNPRPTRACVFVTHAFLGSRATLNVVAMVLVMLKMALVYVNPPIVAALVASNLVWATQVHALATECATRPHRCAFVMVAGMVLGVSRAIARASRTVRAEVCVS